MGIMSTPDANTLHVAVSVIVPVPLAVRVCVSVCVSVPGRLRVCVGGVVKEVVSEGVGSGVTVEVAGVDVNGA